MSFHQSPNRYISHIHLYVTNLKESYSFYVDVLGFHILEKSPSSIILTADGNSALITLEQPEGIKAKQQRKAGLYHYAILLPERSELADVWKHLVKNNYPLQGASDHLVSEAIYLADPDGNGIEIYTDRPADSWEWKSGEVAMTTAPLDTENLFQEGTGSWQGMPENTTIGHIHLHVAELENTRRFYEDGLGFEVVNSQYGSQVLFLSTGGYHHHIGLNIWAGKGALPPDSGTAGMAFYSIKFPDRKALTRTIDKLKAMEVPVEAGKHHWQTADPSGNKIMLRSD